MLRIVDGEKKLITLSLREKEKGEIHAIKFGEGEFNWFEWLNNDRLAISTRFTTYRLAETTSDDFSLDPRFVDNPVRMDLISGGVINKRPGSLRRRYLRWGDGIPEKCRQLVW